MKSGLYLGIIAAVIVLIIMQGILRFVAHKKHQLIPVCCLQLLWELFF